MREIKFRAWDGTAGAFIYSDKSDDDCFFEFTHDGKLRGFVLVETSGTLDEPPGVKAEELEDLDQYTGLKDKNGKEIYEGDVVYGATLDDSKGYVFTVKWSSLQCGFSPFCDQVPCAADVYSEWVFDPKTLEVRGNIYENPGLLAGEKE